MNSVSLQFSVSPFWSEGAPVGSRPPHPDHLPRNDVDQVIHADSMGEVATAPLRDVIKCEPDTRQLIVCCAEFLCALRSSALRSHSVNLFVTGNAWWDRLDQSSGFNFIAVAHLPDS